MDLVILAYNKILTSKKKNLNFPKLMEKFSNLSFLQILINHYCKFNFKNIFIVTDHQENIIKKRFHNKIQNFIKIKCIIEKENKSEINVINLLKKQIKKDFVLISANTFLNFNKIEKLKKIVFEKKKIGGLVLVKSLNEKKDLKRYKLDKYKNIIPKTKSSYFNGNIYYFNKKIFKFINKKIVNLEKNILPELIIKKLISGIYSKDFYINFKNEINHNKSKIQLINHLKKPSIFLDRDGVINHDSGYTHKFSSFKFRKKVTSFLKKISKENFNIFIITNQAGIAKKKFLLSDFFKLHIKLKEYFQNKSIFINDLEYCPHHPHGKIKKYTKKCKCRKPANQMIKNIQKKWLINNKKSIFIGDQLKDKLTAEKSKIKFFYVEDDILEQWKKIKFN